MTDKAGFSLEIDITPGTGFKPLPDWVAFDLCKAYPVPGGNLLLHNTRTGRRAMVKPEVYASLLRCSKFKTLDQHTARIIELNPGMQGQQADIRIVLENMLASGMMISAKEISDELKRKNDKMVQGEATSPVVAIITWERPEALERLLNSIVANCKTGNFQCLYVIDDSRQPENINKNKLLVDKFVSKIDAPLHYYGQDEQQALLDGLASRLPEHENAIRFLADQSRWREHWTSGLARNLALLLSCGHRLVVMDDDVLCDVYNPRLPKPDITFSDDTRETEFFADQQDWAPRHQPINPDPVSRHLQCLGLSFAQALNVLGQHHLKPAGFANATALLTSELQMDSPILMTECGSFGCPGTSDNTWLPDMTPDSLKRMLASAKKTTHALTTRKVWSGRNHPHFSPRANMSQITGLDNRHMLPPYLPIMRGEDRLFGHMLDFIHPLALTLDYPWAIPHLPIPEREWCEQDLVFTPGDSFPMFFPEQVLEQKSSCLSNTASERLTVLSSWFSGLAVASNDALAAIYRDKRLQSTSERLTKLGDLLAEAGSAPTIWQDYLKNGIQQLNAEMDRASSEGFPVKGYIGSLEGDELIMFWKDVWASFAGALNAWPEIREAAAAIINSESTA